MEIRPWRFFPPHNLWHKHLLLFLIRVWFKRWHLFMALPMVDLVQQFTHICGFTRILAPHFASIGFYVKLGWAIYICRCDFTQALLQPCASILGLSQTLVQTCIQVLFRCYLIQELTAACGFTRVWFNNTSTSVLTPILAQPLATVPVFTENSVHLLTSGISTKTFAQSLASVSGFTQRLCD